MPAAVPGIVIAVGIVGVALALIGWRGRRVDDHPICRRCGFDLVGLGNPEGTAAVCPECGRDLSAKRSVRIGTRRRRGRTLVAGMVLTLIAAAGAGVMGWSAAAAFNWNTVKPAWMLISEGRGSSKQTAAAALKELASRIGANRLDEERTTELIGEAIARQGDPAATWFVEWGDIIEAGIGRELLTDEQMLAYVKTGADVTFSLRPRSRVGEKTGMRVDLRTGRVGSTFSRTFAVDLEGVTVDGVAVPRGEPVGARMAISPGGRSSIAFAVDLGAPVGGHTVDLAWRIGEVRGFQDVGTPVRGWTVLHQSSFTVGASDEPLVELVTDPVTGQLMREAIRVRRAEALLTGGVTSLTFEFLVTNSPAPLAVDVVVRNDGAEAVVGRVVVDRIGGGQHATVVTGPVPGFRGQRADLVFRPSEAAALGHPAITAMWGEEIVIRDVAIEWTGDGQPAVVPPR